MAIRVLTSLLRHRSPAAALVSFSLQDLPKISPGIARRSDPCRHFVAPRGSSSIEREPGSSSRSRYRYSTLSEKNHNKELDDINSKFAEAREEIELASESKETVYFNEEAETARVAVQAVLDKYQALLAKLSPEEKGGVQRAMGMKMEQLKAELAQLKE